MLEVRILGQFDIKLDGVTTNLPSRSAQSLLAFLVLNPGTAYRREKLAGLLWPDGTEENARNNLRQALWRIRKSLGNDSSGPQALLLVDEITIAFNSKSNYWLDAAALDRKVHQDAPVSELVDSVSVYRGELLPGFYDDWAVLERERLQAVFERQMSCLMERLIETQSWPEVIEWGERWIALGGVPEPAYRGLMIAHAALGESSRAVAVYKRCMESLHQELGVEPTESTRALYEQIRTGQLQSHETALRAVKIGIPSQQELGSDATTFVFADNPPTPGEPPFKGLQYFEETDADLFFGRERLVDRLTQRVYKGESPLTVVGASGSGKSSLMRAGLVSAIKRNQPFSDSHPVSKDDQKWQVYVITPTAHPLEALAISLTHDNQSVKATATLIDDLSSDPRILHLYLSRSQRARYLIIIDQFEELFTLCRDESERILFIDNLLTATGFPLLDDTTQPEGEGRVDGFASVVFSLRADFYAHCAQYPNLRQALASHQEYIGPMSAEELRRAIEEPVRVGGWDFEPGLVDLILRDAGDQPGALPLLSHALLETWRHRSGHTLTLRGYAQSGGVHGAIARTAETVFNQLLTLEQQSIARNIFLRLTELGEGTEDTRRRAALTELISEPEQAIPVQAVLKTLADARLITISAETAEVAHEALIHEWPTLRQWLVEDREGLRLHRRITEAAQAWDDFERDSNELLRGARLAQAIEWTATHASEMNRLEREYLIASQEWAERLEMERQAEQQRQLMAAQALAEAQRERLEAQKQAASTLKRRALYLTGALILAIVMAFVALYLGEQARQSAVTAQANFTRAENERIISLSRELASAATNNLTLDPERSILLALRAVEVTEEAGQKVLPEAANALHQAVQASRVQRTLFAHNDQVWGLDFSPDGSRLATGSDDGTVKIWDLSDGREVMVLRGNAGLVSYLVLSPDGKRLAATYFEGKTIVWDALSGQEILALPGDSQALGVDFAPDGTRLAIGYEDGSVKIWDVQKGHVVLTLRGHDDFVMCIDFSPDGNHLVTASLDDTAKLWDATTGEELRTLSGHKDRLFSAKFSPDGTLIATASTDSTAKIWDAASGDLLRTLSGHTNEVTDVAFSPDGKHLATAGADGNLIVWETASGRQVLKLAGHVQWVTNVAFSPDGKRLASTGQDGTVRIWDWSSPGRELFTLAGHNGRVMDVTVSPDGTRLVTTSTDETARVWDATTGQEIFLIPGGGNADPYVSTFEVVVSADGQRLSTVSADGTPKVWDMASGRELFSLLGHTGRVWDVDISPDGKRLATAGKDHTVRVWDALTGDELLTLRGHTDEAVDIVFSPDGSRLASASKDKSIRLWDVIAGKELFTLNGPDDWLMRIVFNQTGTRLASLDYDLDRAVRIWDTSTGQELHQLKGHKALIWDAAFSPDGRLVATGGMDATAKMWSVETGEELFSLVGHSSSVWRIVFSPDGAFVATASGDGTTKLWDTTTGQELLTLPGHTNVVSALAFNSDGTRLYSASDDGTVQAYILPIDELMSLARSRLTRTWRIEECQKYLHQKQCPPTP